MTCLVTFLTSLLPLLGPPGPGSPSSDVGPVPAALREARHLDPFYRKHIAARGFPILGSDKVSDAALREAAWIVEHVLEERPEIFAALTANGVHLAVMAHDEYTTDVPEHRDLTPRVYWDRRARGLGGSPVSCAEENLLCFPGDPYGTENILIHEFAHIVHGSGLASLDSSFDGRLRAAFDAGRAADLWTGTYAATDREEYWAEGVQSWFDDNRENDSLHNHVNTRAELRAYDPALAALCEEVLGDRAWRYLKPDRRAASDRAHLAGFDFANRPRFRWREEPIPARPLVSIQTSLGNIELELDYEHAPQTVANFLHYVHQGLYADGSFFRTVTLTNQPDDEVKIEVIQGSADAAKESEFLPPIPLERTRDTGLRHLDGTISMARLGPDTARDHFFLCLGDQPALDFGGARQPDGQGFAAFGRVIENMELVRQIHALPAAGQTLTTPVLIQRAIRMN